MSVDSKPHERPWPTPSVPWTMAQTWHDLLFAHWPIDFDTLRPLVPAALPLDSWDGQAWLGVVPFTMSGVRPRRLPALPWLSSFPELNVRTYVTLDDKPGVYFFSLDAGNRLAVEIARRWPGLPYYKARMRVSEERDSVEYASAREGNGPRAEFRATYRPAGTLIADVGPGTLAWWLTARYCLYTVNAAGQPRRLEIDHAPWPLQPAEAEIQVNTLTAPLGLSLPETAPLLHFARRLDVVVWPARPA